MRRARRADAMHGVYEALLARSGFTRLFLPIIRFELLYLRASTDAFFVRP